jgi:small subunit ribosomal protein S21
LAEVHIQDGETLENALRRFKRKVLQEDIIKEVKRHAFYLKPGQKKRVKSALARKRNRKKRNRDSALEQAPGRRGVGPPDATVARRELS